MTNLTTLPITRRTLIALTVVAVSGCTATRPSLLRRRSSHRRPRLGSRPPRHPRLPGSSSSRRLKGRIVFSAGPAHTEDVYVINADGSGLRRLIADPGAGFDPALSPDGTRIVYRHEDEGSETSEVYVMDADGSDPRNVSNEGAADLGPGWSPDGTRVLWNCQRDRSYGFRACTANPDGTG